MKRCLATVVSGLIVVFSGCQSLPKPNFSPQEPHLSIITYNVNWGGHHGRVGEFLQKANADIVCLQETHLQWENDLKTALKKQYPHCAFHHSRGAGGIAFMSRYPLSDSRIIESEAGWFPGFYSKISTPIGEVGILSVHLKPPLSDNGSASPYALLNAGNVHAKEMQQFFDAIDPLIPMIVVGDFNEDESGKACQWLTERGYTDSLSLFDRKNPTWIWPTSYGIVLKNRYDHIFIKDSLQCTGAGVFAVRASDHEPVLSVVRRNVQPN